MLNSLTPVMLIAEVDPLQYSGAAWSPYVVGGTGVVQLHIKPTRYASNVIGGLLFGVGYALSAYCPGTGATALGQGNFDAISMMLGMLAGSYVFAEASGWIARRIDPVGERGKITLYDLLPINRTLVLLGTVTLIGLGLVAIECLLNVELRCSVLAPEEGGTVSVAMENKQFNLNDTMPIVYT